MMFLMMAAMTYGEKEKEREREREREKEREKERERRIDHMSGYGHRYPDA
jgi:hypothetical protein